MTKSVRHSLEQLLKVIVKCSRSGATRARIRRKPTGIHIFIVARARGAVGFAVLSSGPKVRLHLA